MYHLILFQAYKIVLLYKSHVEVFGRSSRGVVANVQDSNILVSEFEIQLFTFFGKCMNDLIPLAMG